MTSTQPSSYVDLWWLPLGAGGAAVVGASGRAFETVAAARAHRKPQPLFHSALQVRLDGAHTLIEMTPAWGPAAHPADTVATGPVGLRVLGRSPLFRYEVHRWPGGIIADLTEAVESPRRLSVDRRRAELLLSLAPSFPSATWGRDPGHVGDMWNSNSLTSWLLARSGHDLSEVGPPRGGRAPGWAAGLAEAAHATGRAVAP